MKDVKVTVVEPGMNKVREKVLPKDDCSHQLESVAFVHQLEYPPQLESVYREAMKSGAGEMERKAMHATPWQASGGRAAASQTEAEDRENKTTSRIPELNPSVPTFSQLLASSLQRSHITR